MKCLRCQEEFADLYRDKMCLACYVAANTLPPTQLDQIQERQEEIANAMYLKLHRIESADQLDTMQSQIRLINDKLDKLIESTQESH